MAGPMATIHARAVVRRFAIRGRQGRRRRGWGRNRLRMITAAPERGRLRARAGTPGIVGGAEAAAAIPPAARPLGSVIGSSPEASTLPYPLPRGGESSVLRFSGEGPQSRGAG